MNDPKWSQGCIYDEEGIGYNDDESELYPLNPFGDEGAGSEE